MKRFVLKHKFITISGIIIILLYFVGIDITSFIRDIFYFPLTFLPSNNLIVFEDRDKELEEENKKLKELLEFNNTMSDFSTISSVVVNRNTNYWNSELTINKGSLDNIKEGMAVVDGKGLIGKVIDVSLTTSVVKLITSYDKTNRISVKIWSSDGSSVNKILEVDHNNNLIIGGIDNTYDIKIGDRVTTSGISDIFPSGLTIGEVSIIEDDYYGISKKIYVKHISELDNIRFVSVLKRNV